MRRLFALFIVAVLLGAVARAQDPVLQLDAPVGGLTFYTTRDTVIEIRWSGVDDTVAVQLDYTTDNGRRWSVIEDSAKGLRYDWNTRALMPATTYRVRVSQLRPPGLADQVIYSGHNSDVADAWWNPENTRVVSVAGEAHVWDASTSSATPILNLPTGRAQYSCVRWSADSTLIATGADDFFVRVTDVAAVSNLVSLDQGDAVRKVEMDPTGSWLFMQAENNRLQIHRLRPNITPGATLFIGSPVLDFALNSDGSRVAVCSENDARVYSRLGGLPVTFRAHTGGVVSAAFSPDGTRVCSIGGDLSIRMWSSTSGIEIWNATEPREGLLSVAFSPDGNLVAVGMADSSIAIFRADSGILVRKIAAYSGPVRMVQFSADGALVAGASDDNFARVHDVATGETKISFQHGDNVRIARWSKAGDRLLTSSRDGTARVWQVLPIVLQSDTTDPFTIAPPPPAFVRFVATGDTLNIEESTTISIRTDNAQFLGLAEIDSVRLRLSYDPTILFRTGATVPLSVIDDVVGGRSIQYLVCTLPFDSVSKELFTITFQATLGQDSLTQITFDRIEQISKGAGARIEKFSEPILIRGICRVGDGPRLYNPNGAALTIVSRPLADGVALDCTLGESTLATVSVYDVRGKLILQDRSTPDEERSRRIRRVVPSHLLSGVGLVTLTTATQSVSTVIIEGAQP